jgi:hypothetical protein
MQDNDKPTKQQIAAWYQLQAALAKKHFNDEQRKKLS